MSDLRNNQQTTQRKSFFRSNPVMNRMVKTGETGTTGKAASYGGIMAKTIFFLLCTVAGMMLYLVLDNTMFASLEQSIHVNVRGFELSTSPLQVGILVGVAIFGIIMQLLAIFAPVTTPVTGALYSATQGYFISFMVFTLLKGYEYLGLLALVITIAIVLVMSILYTTGTIRATKKFRTVMLTLFGTMIAVSILSFIGYLIPLTRTFVGNILGHFWISLGLTLLSIIIASLFLISDFAAIEQVVENRMPAKFEWSAAFGLAFTVLWIYVKVLDLLIQIVGNSKK